MNQYNRVINNHIFIKSFILEKNSGWGFREIQITTEKQITIFKINLIWGVS